MAAAGPIKKANSHYEDFNLGFDMNKEPKMFRQVSQKALLSSQAPEDQPINSSQQGDTFEEGAGMSK